VLGNDTHRSTYEKIYVHISVNDAEKIIRKIKTALNKIN
jgi:hypothetical protein